MIITVYTDGSASPNPGPGGAGAVILMDGQPIAELIHSGGHTTNNQMELYALIMTFPHLSKDQPVTIYTDSEYVKKGINEWIKGWVRKGWKTASGQPVKNQELWKKLLQLRKDYPKVTVEWIKAHDGHKWNDKADELAKEGTKRSAQNV